MKQNKKNFTKFKLTASAVKESKVVLALGAELKANFCILHSRTAFLYYGYGDLKNPAAYKKYKKDIKDNLNLLTRNPQVIAYDLNPIFLSSRFANELKEKQIPSSRLSAIGHHYAHIAGAQACLGLLKKKVIGISCDGTGLGDNGKVWGCEFIIFNKGKYKRLGHLNNIALPGSDKAVLEPWRIAAALLYKVYGRKMLQLKLPWIKKRSYEIKILIKMIEQGINTPLASSAGRLFDGISALCGVCEKIDHEAQAAIGLQKQAEKAILPTREVYPFSLDKENGLFVINTDEMIRSIVKDLLKKRKIADISACFHNTFAKMLIDMCGKLREHNKINEVVLTGGVFFNDIISKQVISGLLKKKFLVHKPQDLLLGDTGLSLGQAVLAANSV